MRKISPWLCLLLLLPAPLTAQTHWVGTWAASAAQPGSPLKLDGQTVREIVRTSIGGSQVSVRFTNALSAEPVTISAAHLATRLSGSSITPGSDRALTFNGRPSITIPPAAIAVSDPLNLSVPQQTDLAISVYFTGPGSGETLHASSQQTCYMMPGDHAADETFPADAKKITSWPHLASVAVAAPASAAAIVAFGDSITDGARSTNDKNERWPDVLARRLLAKGGKTQLAVLNAGIGGNRILHEGVVQNRPQFGPNALSRFDRDVLTLPGVKYVIVLEGINDLGHAGTSAPASETVTAEDLMAGMRQMIERAHEAGIRIIGATILPFEGASYYTAEKDAKRQALNKWIRSSGLFDGVIDFEKATQDPAQPGRMLARYDSGDHLHPNDTGYEAMGNAIDLGLFHVK